MSKFRKKVTVNIVDIFRFHIRRERGVDVVCHRASGHVPHILLTVFFRHADDIEVRRKSVTQRVDVYIVINACRCSLILNFLLSKRKNSSGALSSIRYILSEIFTHRVREKLHLLNFACRNRLALFIAGGSKFTRDMMR